MATSNGIINAIILGAILGLKVLGISIERKIEIFTKQFGTFNYCLEEYNSVEEIYKAVIEAYYSKYIMRNLSNEKSLLANEAQKLLTWLQRRTKLH